MVEVDGLDIIRAGALASIPHGFLGRRGGVSVGKVAGLQVGLGAGDDPQAVAENRRRAVAAVAPGHELATVYQVHSADIVRVEHAWPEPDRPRADAMVTDRPGLVLGIVTADCAPVLLADSVAGVIGAAHAGWRGAVGGVIGNTIAAMCELGARPERITAAIGPTIAQPSYEVDQGFRDRLVELDAANIDLLALGAAGHYQFDLPSYILRRLQDAGIEAGRAENLALDTYPYPARFYSYRRATHRGESSYGRHFSLIALPG